MRAWPCVVVVAGCYAPHAQPGAPCIPAVGNCPSGETCALVGGSFQCVDGLVPDAASDGASRDAAILIDGSPPDAPAVPRWTLIQVKDSTTATTAIAAAGAGDLMIVAVETNGNAVASVIDNVGNAYTAIPAAHASNSSGGFAIELWSGTVAHGGATSILVAAPTLYATVVWEVAGARTLDTATKLDNAPSTTTPAGATITTSVAGEFVVSIGVVANQISGIHTGNAFTNDRLTYGNGWAHLTDRSAPAGPHQAQWDQPTTGVYCASSAAFLPAP